MSAFGEKRQVAFEPPAIGNVARDRNRIPWRPLKRFAEFPQRTLRDELEVKVGCPGKLANRNAEVRHGGDPRTAYGRSAISISLRPNAASPITVNEDTVMLRGLKFNALLRSS